MTPYGPTPPTLGEKLKACLLLIGVIIIFFFVLLFGLGLYVTRYVNPSPRYVVQDAYWAANRHDYATAQSYISSAVRNFAPSAKMDGAWDRLTRGRRIYDISIGHEHYYKDFDQRHEVERSTANTAIVNATISWNRAGDPPDSVHVVYLVKEEGQWKIK